MKELTISQCGCEKKMRNQINVDFSKIGSDTLEYVREIAKRENRSLSAQVRHILAVWTREHRDQHGQVYFDVIPAPHGGCRIDAYRIDSHGYRSPVEHNEVFGTNEVAISWAEAQGWKRRIA